MNIEEQLRAAGRDITESVRDLPRLTLPPAAAGGARRPRRSHRRPGRPSTPGWLVPLAAAAAVIAIAVTLVAVRDTPGAHDKTSQRPAASGSAPAPAPGRADPEALPEYFVALVAPAHNGPLPTAATRLTVGETRTGATLVTLRPPAGSSFTGATGAADDRTFVVSTKQFSAGQFPALNVSRTWYLLRIAPGTGHLATLTRLPIPAALGEIEGIALSPDGTRLAILSQSQFGQNFPATGPFALRIYSAATGVVLRVWTATDPAHGSYGYGSPGPPDNNGNLSWTADGQRLAFAYRNSNARDSSLYLRMLNLAGPGRDLLADSTVVAKIAASTTNGRSKIWCESLGITGDGQTAVCGAGLPKAPPVGVTLDALVRSAPWIGCSAPTDVAYPGLAEISLATDKLTRVLYEVKPACMGGGSAAILWASPSGRTVLGTVEYTDDPSMKEHTAIILYSHGRSTVLRWPGAASAAARIGAAQPGDVAF